MALRLTKLGGLLAVIYELERLMVAEWLVRTNPATLAQAWETAPTAATAMTVLHAAYVNGKVTRDALRLPWEALLVHAKPEEAATLRSRMEERLARAPESGPIGRVGIAAAFEDAAGYFILYHPKANDAAELRRLVPWSKIEPMTVRA